MPIAEVEKELIAVGISVAAGCRPCTDYHLKAVHRAGASDDEIEHAIADAVAVREDATRIIEDYALRQLDGAGVSDDPTPDEEADRMQVAVSIGAAFAVNCTSSLQRHLVIAGSLGISQQDVEKIAKLAAVIGGKATSHVERLVGLAEEDAA